MGEQNMEYRHELLDYVDQTDFTLIMLDKIPDHEDAHYYLNYLKESVLSKYNDDVAFTHEECIKYQKMLLKETIRYGDAEDGFGAAKRKIQADACQKAYYNELVEYVDGNNFTEQMLLSIEDYYDSFDQIAFLYHYIFPQYTGERELSKIQKFMYSQRLLIELAKLGYENRADVIHHIHKMIHNEQFA